MTVLTVGILAAGLGTLPILRGVLEANLDGTVQQYAQSNIAERLFTITTDNAGSVTFTPIAPSPQTDYYVAIYDAQGAFVASAGGPGDGSPAPDFPDEVRLDRAYISQNSVYDLRATEGAGFRASVALITVRAGNYDQAYSQVVAVPTADVNAFGRVYFGVFLLVAVATILCGALLTRLLVTLTFRRFGQVESTAMQIASGDFQHRMTDIEPSTEIGRLKIAINTMLDRIDSAIDERDATLQQMRRFVGDASHELRTPLVSVRGYAELYRMGALADDESTRKAMERIEAEAKRMGVLVEDLLALTRLDERREIVRVPVDLRPIAHDAALDIRAAEPARRVRVVDHTFAALTRPIAVSAAPLPTTETLPVPRRGLLDAPSAIARASGALLRRRATIAEQPAKSPAKASPATAAATAPIVDADEDKIRQVVANLLGNARRYTSPDTEIGIEVGVCAESHTGWIAVVDHGEGVPEAFRDKIFQRFWRADNSRTRETGGSGLGLSIVSSLVHSLDGEVEVLETPGGGATFRVSLPLAPEEAVRTAALETLRPQADSDDDVIDISGLEHPAEHSPS